MWNSWISLKVSCSQAMLFQRRLLARWRRASVELQAVTFRLPSNSRAKGKGKQKMATNGERRTRASQRFEKVFASSALLAYHAHLGDVRFSLARYRRSFSKLELVSRICLSISCPSILLRDTDFDTGKPEISSRQIRALRNLGWGAASTFWGSMMKFDDKYGKEGRRDCTENYVTCMVMNSGHYLVKYLSTNLSRLLDCYAFTGKFENVKMRAMHIM